MRNASVAEWIVSRATSSEKAASIVGDFVELKSQKGAIWFWLSIARVVLSLSWRRTFGVIATLYAGSWIAASYQIMLLGIHSHHRPVYPWVQLFLVLIVICTFLWVVFVYGAICHGAHDRVAQMAFMWALVLTGVLVFWWQPTVLAACLALLLVLVWNSMKNAENCNAMLILTVTTASGFASALIAGYIGGHYQRFVHPGLVGSKELSEHPSIQWVWVCSFLFVAWNTTWVYSRMHARMTHQPNLTDTEPDISSDQI